jgi:hypothetical protein
MNMMLNAAKIYSKTHIAMRLYNLLRILLYNGVVILCFDSPGFVLLSLFGISSVYAIYIIAGRPHKNDYTWSNAVDSEMWVITLILFYYLMYRVENYLTI